MSNKPEKKPCGCACGDAQETLQTPADAIVAVAILAVAADGKLEKEEIAALRAVFLSAPLFDDVQDADEYIGCIASIIAGRNREDVLEEVAGLLGRSLRETAFAWAVYMVALDHRIVPPEHQFLDALRKKLGLHGVLARKISTVVPMLIRVK